MGRVVCGSLWEKLVLAHKCLSVIKSPFTNIEHSKMFVSITIAAIRSLTCHSKTHSNIWQFLASASRCKTRKGGAQEILVGVGLVEGIILGETKSINQIDSVRDDAWRSLLHELCWYPVVHTPSPSRMPKTIFDFLSFVGYTNFTNIL